MRLTLQQRALLAEIPSAPSDLFCKGWKRRVADVLVRFGLVRVVSVGVAAGACYVRTPAGDAVVRSGFVNEARS